MSRILHQTRGLVFTFLVHWIFLPFVASSPSKWVDSLPIFLANRVHSVVVDQTSGDVIVGGPNVLYHLSADLELKKKVDTGPLKDYPGCPIPPYYSCSNRRVSTDNDVMLLKMVYYFGDPPRILLCGNVYNNLCQIRPIDNLEEYYWVHPYNDTLGYVTTRNLNYAVFERGFDGRLSMFTATQDDKKYRNPNSAPYLSSRVLEQEGDRYHFRYTFQNDTVSSAMTMQGSSSRFPIDDGFVYGDFMYFPVLYFGTSFLVFPTVESRLVRFCTRDPTFRSYVELTLTCNHSGKSIKRLMAAYLGQSRVSTGKALYASFNDDDSGSALCIFEMDAVVEAFAEGTRSCNRDIVGGTCDRTKVQNIVDFCGPDSSPYIVSQTLEVPYFVFVTKYVITVMAVVKQYDELVAIVGPNNGLLLKISMSTGKIITRKEMIEKTEHTPFGGPFVFDKQEKHIYLFNKNKVIKYPVATCAAHETCQECFTRGKTDPLKCGWCAGRCAHMRECADPGSFSLDTCTPSIDEVFPPKGPIQGGITIKITGDNFGTYVDDDHNSILVAGIGCEVVSWNNTQVNCTVGPSREIKSGPIELHVINSNSSTLGYSVAGSAISQSNFSYYEGPILYGIRPNKGPDSGGTFVTLFGQNLDFEPEKKRSVSVQGRLCRSAVFEKKKVTCSTGNSSSRKFPNNSTAIHIDGVAYIMDKYPPPTFNVTGLSQSFEYTPDPYIRYIQPGFTTVSGLVNLTALGRQLDSVKYPKLSVKIDEIHIIGKNEFVEDCWVDPELNGTEMTCRTPSLKGRAIHHPVPRRPHPLVTHISFIMDNVQKLKDFPKHQEDLSRLLYYPDPEFRVFQKTEKIKVDQSVLEIKGTYLDLMQLANNLLVKIGNNETCSIASVSSNILLCDLPPSLFSSLSENGANISVEVFTGPTVHHLGYIQLEQQEEGDGLWYILLAVAFIVITACGVFGVYKWCLRYKKKKPVHIGDVALANRQYRAVPTCASTCSENPVSVAAAIPSSSENQVPVAAAIPSSSENPVPVAAAIPSSSENPVPVAAAIPSSPENTVPVAAATTSSLENPSYVLGTTSRNSEHPVPFAFAQSPFSMMALVDEHTLFQLENKDLIIHKECLAIGKMIGAGRFGFVYVAYLQRSNQTESIKVAVKTLRENSWFDPETVNIFMREALIMREFDHPNVLSLMGVCLDGSGPLIVLPFLENKDLHTYIADEKREVIFMVELLKFAADISSGMSYLEEKKFVHRDLAARNCLLDSDLNAKVADFGLSRDIYFDNYYCQENGGKIPVRWTALESLEKQVFSTKSDVWAYGVLLWELMTRGNLPYNHVENFEVLKYIKLGYRLDQPVRCPLPVYKVMLACWNIDPKKRPSFHQIHDYIVEIKSILENNANAEFQPAPTAINVEHSGYYNSEELYRNMEGRPLDRNVLQEF